jgi:hypothetical protein
MKTFLTLLVAGLLIACRAGDQTNATTVETIVCIRHGEKPHGGLGQLTPRGLNRAMALPKLLLGKYGKPKYIFACDPAQKVDETPPHVTEKADENKYYYLRPLATIEPTAIECGLPVNIEFGFRDIKGLEQELHKPQYEGATTFVVWEHILLDDFAKNMVKHNGGDPAKVPAWTNDDYDMIFVFKITTENGKRSFSFTVDHEGLDGLGDSPPEH